MEACFDREKTLDELEGVKWPKPEFDSYLNSTVYKLRSRPVAEFSVEDLRMMIGQNIGLHFLAPLAVERLRDNPLAEGDFYKGDLLHSVLTSSLAFWLERPDLRGEVSRICEKAMSTPTPLDEEERSKLKAGIDAFARVK